VEFILLIIIPKNRFGLVPYLRGQGTRNDTID